MFDLQQNINEQIKMFLNEMKIKHFKEKIKSKNYFKKAINKIANLILNKGKKI
jgi:hypothetical protein